jgi:hypothetical protein
MAEVIAEERKQQERLAEGQGTERNAPATGSLSFGSGLRARHLSQAPPVTRVGRALR